MNGRVRKPCKGRMAFVSRAAARPHALRQVGVYRCRKCDLFHVGKKPPRERADDQLKAALAAAAQVLP